LGEGEAGVPVRLGGPSCLAGDVIGDYVFAAPPAPRTRIAFLDQAHYSMVKTTTFNGVPLPSVGQRHRCAGMREAVRGKSSA
jgi:carboxynorspermidine decarboxylase